MKSLQEIQRKNQQTRAVYTIMNHNNNRTQQGLFSPQPSGDIQSPFGNTVTNFSDQNHNVIHKSRCTGMSYSQSLQRNNSQNQSRKQQKEFTKQNFFGQVSGIPKINSPKSIGNQTTNSYPLIQVDPKIKHQLSELSKKNFLHFLLIQKVGHKDEKLFYEYLKRTYNFEPPQPDEQQIKLTKKGIKYLYQRDEDEISVKKSTDLLFASILKPHHKHRHQKELPFDRYVQETYEQQLRRYPKVRERMEQCQSTHNPSRLFDNQE